MTAGSTNTKWGMKPGQKKMKRLQSLPSRGAGTHEEVRPRESHAPNMVRRLVTVVFLRDLFLSFLTVCMCLGVCVHRCFQRPQVSCPLELQSQAVMSCTTRVLGPELRFWQQQQSLLTTEPSLFSSPGLVFNYHLATTENHLRITFSSWILGNYLNQDGL